MLLWLVSPSVGQFVSQGGLYRTEKGLCYNPREFGTDIDAQDGEDKKGLGDGSGEFVRTGRNPAQAN